MYKKGNTYKATIKTLDKLLSEGWIINSNGFIENPAGVSIGMCADNKIYGENVFVVLEEDTEQEFMPWRTSHENIIAPGFYIPHEMIEKIYE